MSSLPRHINSHLSVVAATTLVLVGLSVYDAATAVAQFLSSPQPVASPQTVGPRASSTVPQGPAYVPAQPGTFGVGGTPQQVPAVYPPQAPVVPGPYPPRFANQVPTPGRVPQQAGPPTEIRTASLAPRTAEPLTSLEGSTIIGRVGSEVILASEILPVVYNRMAKNASKIQPGQEPQVIKYLVTNSLDQVVARKVLYVNALQKVPKESLDKVEAQLKDAFAKELEKKLAGKGGSPQLGELINSADVSTRVELEKYLISKGSYLALEEQAFKERNLAAYAMQGQIAEPGEVTRKQMLQYYRDHIADYQNPARARWEQLSVRFGNIPDGDRLKAGAAIQAMGNRVLLQGEPFEEVAKESSQGSTASEGGRYDWTSRGSLRSQVLNDALFSQPVGQLGPILEDEEGFHIVRVLERTEAGVTPFEEVQEDITKAIKKERQDGQFEVALERLKSKVQVWTIFDDKKVAKQFVAAAAGQLRR